MIHLRVIGLVKDFIFVERFVNIGLLTTFAIGSEEILNVMRIMCSRLLRRGIEVVTMLCTILHRHDHRQHQDNMSWSGDEMWTWKHTFVS